MTAQTAHREQSLSHEHSLPNLVLEFELRPATAHFSTVAMSFISQAWPTKKELTKQPFNLPYGLFWPPAELEVSL